MSKKHQKKYIKKNKTKQHPPKTPKTQNKIRIVKPCNYEENKWLKRIGCNKSELKFYYTCNFGTRRSCHDLQ